jgi:hypothetical protein
MMLVSHDRRIPKTPNAVATSGAMRIQCGSMFSIFADVVAQLQRFAAKERRFRKLKL